MIIIRIEKGTIGNIEARLQKIKGAFACEQICVRIFYIIFDAKDKATVPVKLWWPSTQGYMDFGR